MPRYRCMWEDFWRGRCKETAVHSVELKTQGRKLWLCEEHHGRECCICGEPASCDCGETNMLVCGAPLCGKSGCRHRHIERNHPLKPTGLGTKKTMTKKAECQECGSENVYVEIKLPGPPPDPRMRHRIWLKGSIATLCLDCGNFRCEQFPED